MGNKYQDLQLLIIQIDGLLNNGIDSVLLKPQGYSELFDLIMSSPEYKLYNPRPVINDGSFDFMGINFRRK